MNPVSRRNFLAHSAATAGAVAIAGQLSEGRASAAQAQTETEVGWWGADSTASDPFVVYIRDAARGEVALLNGEQEIVFTDRALVGRLQRAVRRAGR